MPSPNRWGRAAAIGNSNKPPMAMQSEIEDEKHEGFFEEEDADESDNGGDFLNHDRMPAQHPATRTTAQLMGKSSASPLFIS